mmetsp:Transcript_10296/g.22342  ORF Transcript_10296/g.22342 Transcript_10296/m.22342 type:complete len:1541 (-) Transcript_10296:66-4688(-)
MLHHHPTPSSSSRAWIINSPVSVKLFASGGAFLLLFGMFGQGHGSRYLVAEAPTSPTPYVSPVPAGSSSSKTTIDGWAPVLAPAPTKFWPLEAPVDVVTEDYEAFGASLSGRALESIMTPGSSYPWEENDFDAVDVQTNTLDSAPAVLSVNSTPMDSPVASGTSLSQVVVPSTPRQDSISSSPPSTIKGAHTQGIDSSLNEGSNFLQAAWEGIWSKSAQVTVVPSNSPTTADSQVPSDTNFPTSLPSVSSFPSVAPTISPRPSSLPSIVPTLSQRPSVSIFPTISTHPSKSPAPTPPACEGADPGNCGCSGNRQADYRGTLSETKVGIKCAPWDAPWILEKMDTDDSGREYDDYIGRYPSAGLEENYCRNPNGRTRAWCWTEGGDADFDYCDVDYCFPSEDSCPALDEGEDLYYGEELEAACDYYQCIADGSTTRKKSRREEVESGCLCHREIWDCDFGSNLCNGDRVRKRAAECCVEAQNSTSTTDKEASCDCSIQPDCDIKKDAVKCHIYSEYCCAEEDQNCQCNYMKEACRLALENNLDAKALGYCEAAEQACCARGYGGCKCDFWEPLCNDFSNKNGNCLKASRNCCGNRRCRCDFLTHATKNLGYSDPSNREESNCLVARNIISNVTMETESLRKIYVETGGENWINNIGWTTESHHCDWHGILCDDKEHVTKVNLTSNNVTGKFPSDALSKLHKLQTLILKDNKLWGQMAGTNDRSIDKKTIVFNDSNKFITDTSVFFNMRDLTYVDISQNGLSGEVDVLFAPAVQHVNMSHNNFTSVNSFKTFKRSHPTLLVCDLSYNFIHQNVADLLTNLPPNLVQLFLSRNKIEGVLPRSTDLELLRNLRRLHLDWNMLSGNLPDFSAVYPKLRELNLSNQKQGKNRGLTGEVRQSLSGLPRLTLLNLAGNQFEGMIPPVIGNLALLKILDLSNNAITGEIPKELGKLGGIEVLDLRNNNITGRIPSQLGKLDEDEEAGEANLLLKGNEGILAPAPLKVCFIEGFDRKDDNELCPLERNALKDFYDSAKGQEWTENDGWVQPYKSHCDWYGVKCNDSNSTIELKLHSNGLSGTLSKSIANLSSLVYLDLSDNGIKGEIPKEIGRLTKTTHLRLAYNSFKGNETNFGTQMEQLEVIQVQGNRLSGSIPSLDLLLRKDYSFIADCGHPSEFETNLMCEGCTMCCNAQENCYPTDDFNAMGRLKKLNLKNYSELVVVFFACLFVAAGMLVAAIIAFDKYKNRDNFTSNVVRRKSVIMREKINEDKKYALETMGNISVYKFLLTTSWVGWTIVLATMGAQIWMLFLFVKGSEIDLNEENIDLVYSWKCPRDKLECKDTADDGWQGWVLFSILVIAHLLKDLISGTKLLILSAKRRHSMLTRARHFAGGWLLFSVTAFAMFVTFLYNRAIATSNTELIMNAVIILFICDLDEMFYEIIMVINPIWVDKITLPKKKEDVVGDKEDEANDLEFRSCISSIEEDPDTQGQSRSIQTLDSELQSLKTVVEKLQDTVKQQRKENANMMKLLQSSQDIGFGTWNFFKNVVPK